jgi:phosphoglycolate phosphatase
MVPKQGRIRAIIFDLDGVLLNVYDRYYISYVKAFERKGISKKIDKRDLIQMRRSGVPGLEIIRHLAPDTDEEVLIEIDDLRKKVVDDDEFLCMDYPFPRVRNFLEGLKGKNIALAILTLRSKQNVERQLQMLSLLQYFNKIVAKQNTSPLEGKYDGLIEILREFKVELQNVIFVDDSECGIETGHKIGVITVGVLSGLSGQCVLEKEMPDIILKDVTRLRVDHNKGLIL